MSQNTVDHTNPVDHRAVVESVRSARSFELELPIVGAIPVPRPEQIAYFAVMGLMVAFEIIEWPVAVTIAAGASARNRAAQSRPRRDRRGRSRASDAGAAWTQIERPRISRGPLDVRRNLLRECALHAAFDCCDDLRTQFCGRDDLIHRADLSGPLDVVDRFEFGCHFAELVGADGDALSVQFLRADVLSHVSSLAAAKSASSCCHLRVVVGAGCSPHG